MTEDEGFTLIELLVVIIIIGILAAIAIPVFLSQRTKGWEATAKSDLHNAAIAEETYFTDGGIYTTDKPTLLANGYKQSNDIATGTFTIAINKVDTPVAGTALGAAGFCMTAKNVKGGSTFVWDSQAGGLQPKSVTTCPNTYA